MVRTTTFRVIWPAAASAAACLLFVGARLVSHNWDPAALAESGTRFSQLDPNGTDGYDGQFTFTVAINPDPAVAGPHLDRPAYRYQRIVYPLAARLLALARPEWIPWALVTIAVLAAAGGAACIARWMLDHGQWEGYALGLGLWVGVVASAGLFLHEAVAYGLAALGWILLRDGSVRSGAIVLSLALLAKETTAPFWVAAIAMEGATRDATRTGRRWLAAGGIIFVAWQGWLWWTFGEPGLGSGGAMSTPFELVPLMGFLRIGQVSPEALGLFLLIFGPMVIVPAVWGVLASARSLKPLETRPEAAALLLNSAIVLLVPFSTAREPLGLVRLATGLVLAVLLFAAVQGLRRVLNYSLFWTAMLVLLVRG